MKFRCGSGFDIPELNYQNGIIERYKPDGATIIGLLYHSKNEAAILYTYPADIAFPIISVVDKTGQEIREVRLFELNNCADDAGYSAVTWGTITQDYKVKTETRITTWDFEKEDAEKKIESFSNEMNILE